MMLRYVMLSYMLHMVYSVSACYIICYIVIHYIALLHMLHTETTLYHIMLRYVICCYVMLYSNTLYCIILQYVML